MAEQTSPTPGVDAFERLLRQRAARVVYPPAPDLVARVQRAVVHESSPRTAGWHPRSTFAYAAAAVVLAVAVLLAIEPVRSGVAEFFGLVEGHSIERLPTTPTAPAAASPDPATSPVPPPAASPTATAEPISGIADLVRLQDAAEALGYQPAVPGGHGPLRAVYLLRQPTEGRVVVLEYAEFDLWQSQSSEIHIGKGVPEELLIEIVTVREELGEGYWIAGGRHFMRFLDASGETVFGTERAVDRNVLVWRGEETFYRIETDLPLEDSLAIARDLP